MKNTTYHIQYTTKRLFHWLTATRRRKILSSILSILIVLTTFRYAFLPPKEAQATISEVTASAPQTLNQTSYTPINSMAITPGAGNYLAIFTMEVLYASSAGSNTLYVKIFKNNENQDHTERELFANGSLDSAVWTVTTHAYVTVGDSQAIDVRYIGSSSDPFTARDRALTLIPVDSADVTQVTATLDATTSSSSYTQLTDMAILSPGAGDYLLVFSTSAAGPATGVGEIIDFAVHVNDTIVTHTQRTYGVDTSLDDTEFPFLIAAKVSPGASQDVEIWWRNSGAAATITSHERTLTLIKVDSGELFEAYSATDSTGNINTTDQRVNSMVLTPGAGDYLAIFSSSGWYNDITGNETTFYSFYVNSGQVGSSEREFMHEDSINQALSDMPVFIAGKVSPGASQDVEVMWRGDTTVSRSIRERTFILLKEPEAGFDISGNFYQTNETTGDPGQCNGTTENLSLKVNGSGSYTADCDTTSGAFTFSAVSASAGNTITIYSTGADKANTVYVSDGTADAGIALYEDRVAIRDEQDGTVTIADLGDWDSTDDNTNMLFDVTGSVLTVEAGNELHIHTGDKFDPGGQVTTNTTGNLHITQDAEVEIDNASSVINGSILIDGGGTNTIFDVQANVSITGGSITTSSTNTTVTYTGTPAVTISGVGSIGGGTSPSITFYDLIISGTQTMASATDTDRNLTVNGTMSGSASVTTEVNGDLVGTGIISMSGGTVEQRVPATELFGTSSGINNWAFSNLTFSRSSGTAVIDTNTGGSGFITISGQLLVSKTSDGAGTTLQAGNRTWTLSNSNSGTPFDADQASGTLTAETSTFSYTGDNDGGNVTVENATYNNVNIGGGATETYVLEGAITAGNDLTINANGTLDTGTNYSITVGGSWSNNGAFTANSGTVTMNDADGSEVLTGTMTGSSSFYDLTFNDGAASGAWTLAANSATVTNDFTITGGTVTAPSTTLTIGGNFTNNDVFAHNSGTVVFNDATKTSNLLYSATTTFNNFTVATAGKQMKFDESTGIVTDIDGLFNIQGTNCTIGRVFLDSYVNDDPWEINVSGGSTNIDYADIEDSTANVTTITAENSTENNLGNTNWTINEGACEIQDVNIRGDTRIDGGVRIQ